MNSEVFVDQELSWLERGRVLLSEAEDESLPLRERVQRLATFSSSLDQFYMRGVAALQRRARAGDGAAEADGISPSEKLARISTRAHELAEEQERCFLRTIRPQLASEGIVLIGPADTSTEQRGYLHEVFPGATPSRSDPARHRRRTALPLSRQSLALSGGFDPSDGAVRLSPHHLVGDPPSRSGNAALHQSAGFCPPAYVHPARRRAPAPPVDDLHGLRHRLESCHSRHS